VRRVRYFEKGVSMRIHNLYADPDGETHFRDIEVECADARPWGNLSKSLPTGGMTFVEAAGSAFADWHPAPCRQYVIVVGPGRWKPMSDHLLVATPEPGIASS
jgi:hypothetical protein